MYFKYFVEDHPKIALERLADMIDTLVNIS